MCHVVQTAVHCRQVKALSDGGLPGVEHVKLRLLLVCRPALPKLGILEYTPVAGLLTAAALIQEDVRQHSAAAFGPGGCSCDAFSVREQSSQGCTQRSRLLVS